MVSLCGRGFDSLQLHFFKIVMKPVRFSLFAIMMLAFTGLTSCEKAVFDEENTKTSKDSQNTESKEDSTMSKVTLLLRVDVTRAIEKSQYWKTLQFEVFNKSDKSVAHIVQSIDNDSCGTASVQLTPGTYKVAVLAHSLSGEPVFDSPTKVGMFSKNDCSDVFYAYSVIEVENKAQEVELTLHRATSLIRFHTKDVIPKNVKSFIFTCSGGSTILDLGNGLGGAKDDQIIKFNVVDSMLEKTLSVDIYTFKRSGYNEVELTVAAYKSELGAVRVSQLKSQKYTIPIKHAEISDCSTFFFTDGEDETEIHSGDDKDEENKEEGTSFKIKVDTTWAGVTYYNL